VLIVVNTFIYKTHSINTKHKYSGS